MRYRLKNIGVKRRQPDQARVDTTEGIHDDNFAEYISATTSFQISHMPRHTQLRVYGLSKPALQNSHFLKAKISLLPV